VRRVFSARARPKAVGRAPGASWTVKPSARSAKIACRSR
jgi:hypothetical protein